MEDNATIVSLGHWVFDEVRRQIAEWTTTYRGPVAAAVNVAHREFWSAALLETVTSAPERHGAPPRSLVIEVTESVFMSDPQTARQIMLDLKALGVRLHIDDFGSGQSSLNALSSFPVDTLKIDGAFIRELSTDAQSTDLVRAIIQMDAALGLDVAAECVETPEQAGQLQDMGRANAQGWPEQWQPRSPPAMLWSWRTSFWWRVAASGTARRSRSITTRSRARRLPSLRRRT